MSNCDEDNPLYLLNQAECEIAAYLKATAEVLRTSGHRLDADAWLCAMETLSWPDDNFKKFFRSVSIRAISQIVTGTDTEKMATAKWIDGSGRLSELESQR